MSTISAGTSTGAALVSTGDTTGNLVLQTNGTTTALTLNTAQALGVGSGASFGTSGQVLTSAGSGAAPTWATVSAGYTLGTPVNTTSGTIISFTGIPSGVKQIVVNFTDVSSNSTGNFSIQLGTAGGIITSGYAASAAGVGAGPSVTTNTSTTLFVLTGSKPAANLFRGSVTITLQNSANDTWVSSGLLNSNSMPIANMSAGYVTLSGVLTQLRIQALGDTFDSGQINIAYI